jgi:hypothetical protein
VELSSTRTGSPQIPRKRHVSQGVDTIDENFDNDIRAADDFVPPEPDTPPVSKRVRIEEIDDEDAPGKPRYARFIQPYPRPVAEPVLNRKGEPIRRMTKFESLLEEQRVEGKQPWEPFASREEWELATWLITNVGQKATDDYLKLRNVSKRSPFISVLTFTLNFESGAHQE